MAIVNNGTKVSIRDYQIPSGFTAPAVTTFSDEEYTRDFEIDVLRATVAVADKATTLTNILTDATIGVNKQITDAVTSDYVGTKDVQIYSELTELTSNVHYIATTDFLGNAGVVYRCKVKAYIKSV